jgi:hypothetical protein
MRNFYIFLTSFLFVTQTAYASVCVGSNCELIDLFARNSGTSLKSILSEIDKNIIDPVIDSQKMIASWEGGMLHFTPRGSESTVKILLWGGGTWRQVTMDGTLLGSRVQFDYYTGNASLSLGAELPLGKSTDLILNGSFWSGPSDYGLGVSGGDMNETSVRGSVGIRQTFFQFGSAKFFGISGISVGQRSADMTLGGSTIRVRLQKETISWSGEEKYYEKNSYLSIPTLVGISYATPWITFSAAGGTIVIFQSGKIELSKWGPLGPYGGYYGIGIKEVSSINDSTILPVLNFGAECNLGNPVIAINFRPSLNSMPFGGFFGLGWKFLLSR